MNCDSTTHKTVIVYIILVSWGDNLKNSHTISQQKKITQIIPSIFCDFVPNHKNRILKTN